VSSVGLALLARLEPDLIADAGTAAAAAHGTVMTIATLEVAIAVSLAWYLADPVRCVSPHHGGWSGRRSPDSP